VKEISQLVATGFWISEEYMAILTPRYNILEWWCYRAALCPHLESIRIVEDQDPLSAGLAEVGPETLLYL
jgi:hypothetical protein